MTSLCCRKLLLCLLPLLLLTSCRPSPSSSSSAPIRSVHDLAGKKAAVMNGSVFPIVTERIVKGVSYFPFNDNPSAIQALRSGKVDAFLADEPIARLAVAKFPQDLRFVEVYAKDTYGIAFPKGSRFTPKVRNILLSLRKSGELEALSNKWCRNADDTKKVLTDWNRGTDFTGANGTFTYLCDPTSPPMSYMGPNGKLIGLELDLMGRITHELNMNLVVKSTAFDGLIPALMAGKATAVGGSMSITKERQEKVDFPAAHYEGGMSIVAHSIHDTQSHITDFSQLYGKRIGVQSGTTWEDLVKQHFISSEPVVFEGIEELPKALKEGKIHAFLADEPQAKQLVSRNPALYILTKKLTSDDYGFAVPHSRPQLCQDINRQLTALRADGTLKQLQAIWFSDSPSQPLPPPRLSGPSKGELRLAVNPQIPPFAFMRQGQCVGYELDLAQHIAARLGYTLKPMSMGWQEALEAVKNGQASLGAGCITITEDRKRDLLFSTPIYQGGIVVITTSAPAVTERLTPWQWLKRGCLDLQSSFHRTLILEQRWKMLLKGLKTTIVISVLSALLGTLLAFILCVLDRSQSFALHHVARCFISLMQGTPILVFLMILYYLVFASVDVNPILIAVVGFGLNFAAYVSEMFRTGLEAIPKGQYEAAMALGFSKCQTYVKVIIPQVCKRILPIYRGEFISLLKSTSIVGYIAIEDLTQMSDNIRSRTYEAFFPLILTSLIYFLTAHLIVLALDRLGKRLDPICRRDKVRRGKRQ